MQSPQASRASSSPFCLRHLPSGSVTTRWVPTRVLGILEGFAMEVCIPHPGSGVQMGFSQVRGGWATERPLVPGEARRRAQVLGCTCLPDTSPRPLSAPIWTPTSRGRRVGGAGACPLPPSSGQLEAPAGLGKGNLGLGFPLNGTCRGDFLSCYISITLDAAPPLALNGSGFESFLQNYTTASCSAVPQSPSVQRRGAALALPCRGAHVGSAPGLSLGAQEGVTVGPLIPG